MTRAQRGRGRRWDAHGSPGGRPCHVLYKPGSSCTVSGAVRVVPLYEAEIVTVCVKSTIDVLTLNVTLTAPAGTVTLGGTEAAELLLDSVTCAPPAAPSGVSASVESPAEPLPPVTVGGFASSEEKRTGFGFTVRVAVRVTPL